MNALACTRAIHLALTTDDLAWSRLPLLGVQQVEADGDEPAYQLEVRDCARCASTLSRRTA